ncbi:MAG TPA: DUF1993 domain-containing protein [Candidatus Cybelea sp.]|nr:DUF1993 domain-containing protein [Candidatus Cybelea sp.]
MAIQLYDVSVTSFLQVLGGVAGYLDKGRAHCESKGIDLNGIVDTRLQPDMLPFRFQVIAVAHHSLGAIEGVQKGLFGPPTGVANQDYAALQNIVADARAKLQKVDRAAINALEGKDVIFQIGDRKMPFTAEGFLMSFSLPNLHFHATTAYDILRMNGAPIGKRDYLAQMRMKG